MSRPVPAAVAVAIALATAGAVAVAVLLAPATAAADPHQWIDDEVTTSDYPGFAGGHVTVERREMLYGSGYIYTALTAAYRPARGPVRRTLLAEGPTMCSGVHRAGDTLVVATCVERFGDTVEEITWRLDRATGRFIAGAPRYRSPYAEQARAIVGDLRAGRDARALAALDRLGDSPDGQGTIAWWWSAQRLLADWPAITRARPADARRRLVPHVERLLAPDDAGEPSVRAALDADLTLVPRTGYRDGAGRPVDFRVGGPRRLRPILTRAVALLRAGDADHVALATALAVAAATPPSPP